MFTLIYLFIFKLTKSLNYAFMLLQSHQQQLGIQLINQITRYSYYFL